uniref:Uncharacterized protein n=1 Tax=Aegilops tauschii subsp. strangulata TaxID=200361 RepID=A0A453FE56_AEGTS
SLPARIKGRPVGRLPAVRHVSSISNQSQLATAPISRPVRAIQEYQYTVYVAIAMLGGRNNGPSTTSKARADGAGLAGASTVVADGGQAEVAASQFVVQLGEHRSPPRSI